MKHAFLAIALGVLAFAVSVSANSRIKVDTVLYEYAPVNSPTNRERVSMSAFHFEVNQETGRARLVVEYTYPDQMTYGPDDDGGPRPTIAQFPGLTYDAPSRSVVYDSAGNKVICATVGEQAGFFGHHLRIKNTGACTVRPLLPTTPRIRVGTFIDSVRSIPISRSASQVERVV